MTKLLDDAVAAVRRLSSERQDEIAASILGLAEHDEAAEAIDPEPLDAIEEGLAQIERGEFAGGDEVEAAFARFRAWRSGSRSGRRATSPRSRTTSRA